MSLKSMLWKECAKYNQATINALYINIKEKSYLYNCDIYIRIDCSICSYFLCCCIYGIYFYACISLYLYVCSI